MGRKNRYNDKNYCTNVGESLNDAVWSLETRTFQRDPLGNLITIPFTGTGFLFKRKTLVSTRYFLVSNRHVLAEGNPDCLLLKLPPKPISKTKAFPRVTYPLYPSKGKSLEEEPLSSVVHAHPTLDLAIIDVTEKIRELKNEFAYRKFEIKSLEAKDLPISWDIPTARPVHYLGFPDESINPEIKKGHIKENPKFTQNIGFDDMFVAQGASGSPAFLNGEVGHYPKFLGVMESTASSEPVEGFVQFVSGYAVKSTDLLDFINDVLHNKGFHM